MLESDVLAKRKCDSHTSQPVQPFDQPHKHVYSGPSASTAGALLPQLSRQGNHQAAAGIVIKLRQQHAAFIRSRAEHCDDPEHTMRHQSPFAEPSSLSNLASLYTEVLLHHDVRSQESVGEIHYSQHTSCDANQSCGSTPFHIICHASHQEAMGGTNGSTHQPAGGMLVTCASGLHAHLSPFCVASITSNVCAGNDNCSQQNQYPHSDQHMQDSSGIIHWNNASPKAAAATAASAASAALAAISAAKLALKQASPQLKGSLPCHQSAARAALHLAVGKAGCGKRSANKRVHSSTRMKTLLIELTQQQQVSTH